MSPDRVSCKPVDSDSQKLLGESIRLPVSGLLAPSRFLKAAMTERLASWDQSDLEKRGIPSEQYVKLYETWGKGGFGIIVSKYILPSLPYSFRALIC